MVHKTSLAVVFAVGFLVANALGKQVAANDPNGGSLKCPRYSSLGDDVPRQFGCYRGYCFTTCVGAGPFFYHTHDKKEWCYTTWSYSQSFVYIPCTKDEDCCENLKCAGSCTI